MEINRINTTELRIGNLIYTENDNEEDIVLDLSEIIQIDIFGNGRCNINEDIGKRHSNIEDYCYFTNYCKLIPIPLTEEWLFKFGFEGSDIDNYSIELSNGNFFILDSLDPIARNIFYVHQLQNLYFALTGKELIMETNVIEKGSVMEINVTEKASGLALKELCKMVEHEIYLYKTDDNGDLVYKDEYQDIFNNLYEEYFEFLTYEPI